MGENPGTRVRVEGLNHDVMDDDIKELFSGVGDLIECGVGFTHAARNFTPGVFACQAIR